MPLPGMALSAYSNKMRCKSRYLESRARLRISTMAPIGELSGTIRSFGFAQIVYHHFCRTEAYAAVPIASLESLENDMIRLRRIVTGRDGFMISWVEWLPHAFFRFDTVSE
jgi:hypothetical protein